jgi:hypothetical protein
MKLEARMHMRLAVEFEAGHSRNIRPMSNLHPNNRLNSLHHTMLKVPGNLIIHR